MRRSKNDIEVSKHVFKVAEPFRINRHEWANDRENRGYAIIGTNYSEDYSECDVIYYTEFEYGVLGDIVCELKEKEKREDFGYMQCAYPSDYAVEGSGGMLVRIPD